MSGNWFPVGKEGASTTYSTQRQCEESENHACYEVTGKDPRYYDVVDGELVLNQSKKDACDAADAEVARVQVAIACRAALLNLETNLIITGLDKSLFLAKLDAYIGD